MGGFQRRLVQQLEKLWPVVGTLDTVRQRVLLGLVFNLGVKGLLAMRRFVAAVEFHFWETAAEEMLNSPWAERHKKRARALAEMMRTGLDEALPVR
jgi:hypothetical protein